MEKKKKFLKPELEVIDFQNDDIITESLTTRDSTGLDWGDDDNTESL